MKRLPVLRDRAGYNRGYLQYLSFDVPLFFRILFGPRRRLIVTDPPPTSGFFVRIACFLRRTPYVYYAADVWSDATASIGAPRAVVAVVRAMERFACTGARGVLSVNAGVTERIREIAPQATVHTTGNGIDTAVFKSNGETRGDGRFVIYTGTASEWQGADVFVRAIALLHPEQPDLRLVFLGRGSAWEKLQELANELDAPVDFIDTVPPDEAAGWLRGAVASVVSIHPGAEYNFAFPTKLFASWATGTPTVYAGPGPAQQTIAAHPLLGAACDYDPVAVAAALREVVGRADASDQIAGWAEENVSLAGVARRSVGAAVS
ncbi:glycosyltransferase family 4 protein [Leucobacter insecticola]|uniref:Glycosyltransferase family 4 protein n=1 Tax=Leucobacter insecticola TaxID=2714934 RepID=A0A6G8FH90_9MICO|nr:glycosyltransferase [Leucobacter insecticola]QIM15866.1 glycosyltransferase family 4 protein [Leucobacter insecticola]